MSNLTRPTGAEDEPGRSPPQGLTGTTRSADAALVEVSLKGPAADAAAPRDDREKRAAVPEDGRPPCERWGDADIAATAATLLAWRAADLGFRVLVTVHGGWITLSGHVDWVFQKDAVEQDVRRLLGVTGVTSTIETRASTATPHAVPPDPVQIPVPAVR